MRRTTFNEDHEAFRLTLRDFIEKEVVPHYDEWYAAGLVPRELYTKLGELGIFGIEVPEEYGGAGISSFKYTAVMTEEVTRAAVSFGGSGVHTALCLPYILSLGTAEQKQRWLPPFVTGEQMWAIAMTEPGTGSDLQAVRTRAERRGDHYVLNGSKTFISNGYLAGVVLVVAKTDPSLGAKGISILIVDTQDAPGFRVGRMLDKIGQKAQDTSELFFDDVRVPAENVLGGVEGQGFVQLMTDLPYERTMIGVIGCAAMEGAYPATLDYVRERKAFGRTIADFQNTKFKLAEIATTLKVARAFLDQCVERLVAGTLDGATAAMLKLWVSEQQGRVVDECLQLHGGYGYMNEYPIARMYVDARIQRIYGGTNEIMKELISRAL